MEIKILPKDIKLTIYNFDGVMTDNKAFTFQDGKEVVSCNRSDGPAISKIKQTGIPQIIPKKCSKKQISIN